MSSPETTHAMEGKDATDGLLLGHRAVLLEVAIDVLGKLLRVCLGILDAADSPPPHGCFRDARNGLRLDDIDHAIEWMGMDRAADVVEVAEYELVHIGLARELSAAFEDSQLEVDQEEVLDRVRNVCARTSGKDSASI